MLGDQTGQKSDVTAAKAVHRSSASLNRRLFPNRNEEKPRRSDVRILSAPDNSAIQTRVASGKSMGTSAYLLISRTAAASASELKTSRTLWRWHPGTKRG